MKLRLSSAILNRMEEKKTSTAYNAKDWEDKLYALWQESGFFNPDVCIKKGITAIDAKPFSIVLPPPNVTGTLHVGHAAMLAIEDAIVRFHRMKGDRTLWIPGTDHAAIATHAKVESILFQEESLTRHDIGREAFIKKAEDFAKESHDTIVNQVAKMGSSVDWSREAYTLDEKRNLAVRTAFKKMYDDGIIYRGERIVNWDPKMQTTVSDDEIEWREVTAPLYYLQYGPFIISTARPETKFGDKYVVMHPEDERYAKYKHGQEIELEWINGPVTATVIKDEAIDREFGTGVMTITPWHDNTDFEIATRHDLAKEQIIDENGKLLPIAGNLAGLPIEEARQKVIEILTQKKLVVKVEEHYVHNIATNSRGGGTIEPQIKKQWWINVTKEFERDGKKVTLKSLMQDAVRQGEKGEIDILPERFKKVYFHWIDNLRDWCISRQLWYGHRIPVWYCLGCQKERVDATVKARWFLVRHGETDWNVEGKMQGSSDRPLNDTGRKQAKEAASFLKGHNIEAIFSSGLLRAKETAEIIQEQNPAELIIDDRLRERDAGRAEGMLLAEIHKLFPTFFTYHGKIPEAENESYKEAEERMWEAVSEHREKHLHKNVVIVSHSGALRALLRKIKNVDPQSFREIKKFENAKPLQLDILDEPCENCEGHFFEQDPDTLDTWFSSGLWTFSTLGWPNEEEWEKNKIYHPTSLLETGYDILFFWVARMILMSEYLLQEVPFKTVYLHGLVRDEQGRKMSKSLGNIIDPLDVISEYGADAMRLSLVIGSTPGNDIRLSKEKIVSYRNFVNKLWNMSRYVSTLSPLPSTLSPDSQPEAKTLADKWILIRLVEVTRDVTAHLEQYQLSLASETLRDFSWNEFADWYLEIHKEEKNGAVLSYVFQTLLRLWHPFMPFVTEAIFQTLSAKESRLLMVEKWPSVTTEIKTSEAVEQFRALQSLITKIRNIRALYHIDPKEQVKLSLVTLHPYFQENIHLIKKFARLSEIEILDQEKNQSLSARITDPEFSAFLHLEGVVNVDKERARLSTELKSAVQYKQGIEKRLGDTHFTEKAPARIIEQNKTALRETEKKIQELENALENLVS